MVAPSPSAPRLRIADLEVKEFRSLRHVNWPGDGLGWGGQIHDIVLVGGANGSGKTTLLELLFGVVRFAVDAGSSDELDQNALALLPRSARRVRVTIQVGSTSRSIAIGSEVRPNPYLKNAWSIGNRSSHEADPPEFMPPSRDLQDDRRRLSQPCMVPDGPKLLYFPTDRTVTFPETRFKGPGVRSSNDEPTYRYHAPGEWMQSIEASLYDARWRDLNAKDRGHLGSARNFSAFEATMQRFFGETKRFHWDDDGVLHIQTHDGILHPLSALSSGEKQVLLFGAELYRRWTPGSLILLDEPELHLHEAWIVALWGFLGDLQRERGGQVIITTQSNYLFGLGEAGSRVILGGAP